jgi:pyrroline-5-carboxylate reductase
MFKFLRKKIGIIGYGNMGSAIAQRIKRKYFVIAFDKDENKTQNLLDMKIANNVSGLVNEVDVVILAVKPQELSALLNEIKDSLKNKLVISIAAGITTKYIERILGSVRVIRGMPNIGAIVGQGVSYICKGRFSKEKDLKLSIKLFNLIGYTFKLKEDLMNAATAVGGSSPGFWGYLFDKKPKDEWDEYKLNYFIPELTSAAMSVGFEEKTARLTASFVTTASISVSDVLHLAPAEITRKVASKGGTTEAGLEVLQKGGTLTEAVKAAVKRAEELSEN